MKCLTIATAAALLLVLCVSTQMAHAQSAVVTTALQSLYASAGGATWTMNTGWTAATGPCTTAGGWYGITCDGNTAVSNVVAVNLTANNLKGSLSPTIGNLGAALQQFYVTGNANLGGKIDESFGSLTGLVNLSLAGCDFSTLPTGLTKLVNLELFDVSRNGLLSGTLNPGWSAWTKIKYVYLGNNLFAGELPAVWGPAWQEVMVIKIDKNIVVGGAAGLPSDWSQMTKLEVLDVHNCWNLQGGLPESWSALTNLKEFRVNNTAMTGDLPVSWNSMVNMVYFEATSCKFTGQIPHSWFANWTVLEVFDVYQNQIFGDLPDVIASPKLTYFNVGGNLMVGGLPNTLLMGNPPNQPGPQNCFVDFSHNAFYGTIPNSWGNTLFCVVTLALDHNLFLSGPLPTELPKMASLKFLSLYETHLSGDLPASWATFPLLEELVLQGNQDIRGNIIGALPAEWNMPNLKLLDLSFNDLTGAIPASLTDATKMPKLESINLMHNKFTYATLATLPPNLKILALNDNLIASDISNMVPGAALEYCYLYNNNFYGSLPPALNDAKALYDLRLQNNFFTGTVPSGWYHEHLGHILLYNNQLTGRVPVQFLYAKGLESFLVGENKFNGTLLSSLAPGLGFSPKSPNIWLNYFNVSYNQIEGPLPDEWSGDTPFLVEFDVSHNKISGNLPNYINTTAQRLYLSHNDLSGTLPANWSLMKNTQEIDLGHNGLTGTLPNWVSNFSTLKHLSVSFNLFTGSLPTQWPEQMVDLEYLRLSGNNLECIIPDNYGTFLKLTKFEAGLNKMYGALPFQGHYQKPMPKLSHLFLASNYFQGTLPPSWGVNMPAMQFVNVASNFLQGTLPDQWKDWKSLNVINVEANFAINGTLPASWGHPNATLTGFSAAFTGVSGAFPESWMDHMPLNTLNLQGVQSIGGLPNKAFPSMLWLSVDYMTFADGVWPDKLINSYYMQEVTMRRCGLTGPLPALSSWKLRVLDLSQNSWTGSLMPPLLPNSSTLRELVDWDTMSYLNLAPIDDSESPQLLSYNLYTYFDHYRKLYQVGGFTYRNPLAYKPSFVTGLIPIAKMPFQIFNKKFIPFPAISFLAELNGFGMTDFKEKFLSPYIVLQYRASISPYHPSDLFGPFPWLEWQTVDELANGLLFMDKMQIDARFGVKYTLTIDFKITYYIDGRVQKFSVSSVPVERDPCTPTTFAVNGTRECMSCPAGGICDGFANVKSSGDVWRPNDNVLPLVTCDPNLQGCAGAGDSTTNCKKGYNGFMCGNCDESVGYYKASRGCGSCSTGASTFGKVAMILICIAVTVVLAYLVAPTADGIRPQPKRETFLSIFKFIFNFMALMGMICYTDAAKRMAEVGWGALDMEGFLSGATFFNQLYFACGFDTYNGHTQLVWASMTFLILLAFTIIPVVKTGLGRPSNHSFWYYIVAGVASTLHLCYNALAATSFRMMDICEYTTFTSSAFLAQGHVQYWLPGYRGNNNADTTTTFGYLHSDPSISCAAGASRSEFFVDGFMTFFFLCALIPGLLFAAHKRIQSTTDDDTATNVFYYFSLNYRTDTWYWEYVLFVRKCLIVAIVAFAPKYAQLTLLAALFGLNLYMNERFRPFASDRLASADSLTIACAFLTVSIMSFALSAEGNTTGDAVMVLLVQLATFGGLGFLIFKYVTGDDTVSVGSKYGGLASGERLDTGFTGGASPTAAAASKSSPGGNKSRSARDTDREENELKSVAGHMTEEPGGSGGYGGLN